MTTTRHIPDKARSGLFLLWQRLHKKLPSRGYFLLVLTLLLLSALTATDFNTRQPLLTLGEIAPNDVIADSTFLLKDGQATAARRDLARTMQPLVLDLLTTPADTLHDKVHNLLLAVNAAHTPEQKEALRLELAQETGEDIPLAAISLLAAPVVQAAILESLLPLAEQRLRRGVLPEVSIAGDYPGGIIIRNLATNEEVLHQDAYSIIDSKGLTLQLSQQIKELAVSGQAKRAMSLLFDNLLRPTLMPNFETTTSRADAAAQAVDPVMYRVLKGEMIIQQGDRITREQQLKMQTLLQKKADFFHPKRFIGIFLCGLLVSTGLLFSPSGKAGSPVTNKDFIFLATLLTMFVLLAKGLSAHGEQIAAVTVKFLPESLAFALPVAGAAALSAQVFSTRRYLVTGLLLALFCTLVMGGNLPLFLFYFLSAMWSTWLTSRSTSRRDVVWSLLPQAAGLIAMWAAATLMQDGAHNRYASELIAVAGGAFLSMVLIFALSPVVEMVFGYTTRFRLMELMNLEQPLLRDLMITAPGTYHHSLIVSNMCEAGAKRVGAHGLLCKVAALYHDVGKISKAGYFIENQLTDDNPHNRLAPSMSALILISHVKQGEELGKQHRLGKEVTDIIRQHHGNNIIQYFYRKAMNQTDAAPPNVEDFRYPGPKPQSREAALVMLADIVEASSRTLDDPTPTRLRQHIDNIMKGIYAAGQLDESELTFKDLDLLADSFQQILRGLYHHRISYPGGPPDKKASPGKAGSGAKTPERAPAEGHKGVAEEQGPAKTENGIKTTAMADSAVPRADVPPLAQ